MKLTTTIKALEALTGGQYFAFCLDDGKLANNAEEATGILLNKPASGDFASVAYAGEVDYRAGAAIAAGAKLTVTTSGYFITADSQDDTVIGEAKTAITSGGIGTGFFCFPNNVRQTAPTAQSVTCALAATAYTAYCLKDNKNADNGEETNGFVTSALNSGDTGEMCVTGICVATSDPALCTSAGDAITVTTSGYIKPADSGDYIVGRAMANIGSNSTGNIVFAGQGYYLSV